MGDEAKKRVREQQKKEMRKRAVEALRIESMLYDGMCLVAATVAIVMTALLSIQRMTVPLLGVILAGGGVLWWMLRMTALATWAKKRRAEIDEEFPPEES